MTEHKLSVKNIAKSYKRPIVEDVSLEVKSGEIVVLLGPNGAGKTTTFYTIVGLVEQDSGDIFIDDQCITNLPIYKRAQMGIGYLPQEVSIFRQLSVRDNIYSVLQLRKDLNEEQREEELNRLLEQFHITHIVDSVGQALSGGEKRRVEIARALAANPKFILLDEPFAGVDPISVEDIKNNIYALKNLGIGILITDHNVKATLEICDRAYIIGQGHVIASGTPDEVKANERVQELYIPKDYL
ncbi:LPS export ABC transporter ATP-binding protein [Psittacicella melopsittaci]|uniref:Lipopolysaccharide export system ATP-binding protein LptB n=1 Tax=Psittacicella melopsittaci TaxID=2028576 RepID=A0A3A1Y303_9GAMM|nr:LPS export ABC transporter ATP-binding protein [Psittacicella melopsittaci]RIY31669.1 LPS export ABC transporter ATP-binding protein [Psittacicella melopsittaci]